MASGVETSLRTGLRSFERIAARIRHSDRLDGLDRVWAALRPAYNRALTLAGGGSVRRVINGDTPVNLGVAYRDTKEEWEPAVWHSLMGNLRPGDVFLDVGAHIGLYALGAAQRVGPSGRVYAFEADPETANALEKHVAINRRQDIVRVVDRAVGSKVGEIAFRAGGQLESAVTARGTEGGVMVPVTTIDAWLPTDRVNIMKIDVEGYEAEVLTGACQLLGDKDRAPSHVYIELHPYAWSAFDTSFEAIQLLLAGAGYEVVDVCGTRIANVSTWCEVIARRADGTVPTRDDREP